jgi:hypothetical protein
MRNLLEEAKLAASVPIIRIRADIEAIGDSPR